MITPVPNCLTMLKTTWNLGGRTVARRIGPTAPCHTVSLIRDLEFHSHWLSNNQTYQWDPSPAWRTAVQLWDQCCSPGLVWCMTDCCFLLFQILQHNAYQILVSSLNYWKEDVDGWTYSTPAWKWQCWPSLWAPDSSELPDSPDVVSSPEPSLEACIPRISTSDPSGATQ